MRLTLDLDRVTEKRAEQKARLLCMIFPGKRVKYRISSSGKGAHIVVHDCTLSWKELCQYRYILGDDSRRIGKDQKRKEWGCTQVLFTRKKEKTAGRWIEL